jgi:hypothetical protein
MLVGPDVVRIGIGMDIDVHRVTTGRDMTPMGTTDLTGAARRITRCGMAFAYGSAISAGQLVT